MKKKLFSTSEVAKILGISRVAVFKKIKSGAIKARRVGHNFIIIGLAFGVIASEAKQS